VSGSYSIGTISGSHNVGGVVGLIDNGINLIENCAALNPSVTAGSTAGRVVGYISGANTITGNVAWSGMTLTGGTIVDTSDEDGTDITTAQVRDGTGLPPALKTASWSYTAGALPILIGLAGQTGALPAHL
jgi:hypothetical protein